MSRHRAWIMVINNPTEYDLGDCLAAYDKKGTYMVLGFEIGSSGTEHIQGYIHFKESLTERTVRKLFPRGHVEPARGSADANDRYSGKRLYPGDGKPIYFGVKPQQGKVDWDRIEQAVLDPRSDPLIANQYRRLYNDTMQDEPTENKQRYYFSIQECQLERYAKELREHSVRYCVGFNVYKDQKWLFIYENEIALDIPIKRTVLNWSKGIDAHYKFGFEIKKFDPDVVILITASDSPYFIYENKYLKEYKGYSWLRQKQEESTGDAEQSDADDI